MYVNTRDRPGIFVQCDQFPGPPQSTLKDRYLNGDDSLKLSAYVTLPDEPGFSLESWERSLKDYAEGHVNAVSIPTGRKKTGVKVWNTPFKHSDNGVRFRLKVTKDVLSDLMDDERQTDGGLDVVRGSYHVMFKLSGVYMHGATYGVNFTAVKIGLDEVNADVPRLSAKDIKFPCAKRKADDA